MAALRKSASTKSTADTAASTMFRTTPIKDSIKRIPQLPKSAILYKCAASKYWQFRVFLDGAQRKRSTKTQDHQQAIKAGKLIYAEMLQTMNNTEHGAVKYSTRKTLDVVAKSLFAKQEVMIAQGELGKNKNKTDRYVYNKHIKPFFANTELRRINSDKLDEFKAYMVGLKLAKSSQKVYLNIISKLLKEAVKKEYLTHIPIIPNIRTEDEPRGYFESGEYTKLWNAAKKNTDKEHRFRYKTQPTAKPTTKKPRKNAADTTTYRAVKITIDCYFTILFMRNTFIRPTDLKFIRHRDVHVINRDGITLLELRHQATKRHSNYMVSTANAHEHYVKIVEQRKKEGYGKANDYIFMPQHSNRDYALKELTRQFDAILDITNLKRDSHNKKRTLYSLRHTAIMSALRNGYHIGHVAANARTSVDMIERFYGSPIKSTLELGSHIIENAKRIRQKQDQKLEAKQADKQNT